jgi:hypothetical protein
MPFSKGFKSKKTLLKEQRLTALTARWKPLNQEKELTRLRGAVNAADETLRSKLEESRAAGVEEVERVKHAAAAQ